MFIQPIDYYLAAWFTLVAISTLYVAVDQYRNNPEPMVMKWGFILVTLYTGPFGLLVYVLADKEPRPGEHEAFIKPLWKQGVGSTIHCVAGDATGIILAAVITATLGLPMWIDLIVEYVAGFAFGLFIFQALFMKSMMGGSYLENVKRSFVPEFISMNFMMAAMAPLMAFLMMGRDMRAMEPGQLVFWGVMSLGVMAGFSKALKHGLMTERKPGGKFASAADATDAMPGMTRAAGRKGKPTKASAAAEDEGSGAAMKGMAHSSGASPKVKRPTKNGEGPHAAHGDGAGAKPHGKAAGHEMRTDATRTQIAALGFVSVFALMTGMAAPWNWINMRLSVRDVGGAIMPPGMVMERNLPGDAMRDMSAANPNKVTARYGLSERGDQPLPFRMVNGVKVFELTASVIRWTILPGVTVDAYGYNGMIPGPRIHIRQGDRVRINVHNRLPEVTTVHWHGLILPNNMDGASEMTQAPIKTGGSYTYEFTAEQHGTYFYHPHARPDRTQALGLYGALIIDPANPADEVAADHDYVIQLQEWLKKDGLTFPAMPMDGMQPNFFTINGKAYPSTDVIHMKVGETLKVRFIGTNAGFIHPMHIHGGPFEVVARDGETVPASARFLADTVNVGPGQRYDVVWRARRPGKWMIHCHIPHHTENNNTETMGGGGLMVVIDVAGPDGRTTGWPMS
jgi:FtsP/CotA-like multicopper oxidase with cupredoxin domain